MRLWRNLTFGCLFACIVAVAGAPTAETKLDGVLIDRACSEKAETRIVNGSLQGGIIAAYNHTRKCALMPACQKSGYGIVPYENSKFLSFDEAGNRKALALLKESKKEDDLRVEVTGVVQGDKIKVTSIKFL